MSRTKSGLIAPSLLSANFACLSQEVLEVEQAGADWIHFDVMDGHFVPNLTFGSMLVKALRPVTKLPFDCHLMVTEPERWIEGFAKAGATSITVHVEASLHLHRLLTQIRELGCQVGVSLNPATPLTAIEEVLEIVDLVLVMSVNPGFGGQRFIEKSLSKVERLSQMRGNLPFLIEVDGGVDFQTIRKLYQVGADAFVAGSAIFGAKDRKKAIQDLKSQLI